LKHLHSAQNAHFGSDAIKVADAIVVAVGEAARVDFVENGILPPLMALGSDRLGLRFGF
jgi:hypothetical protein